MPRYKWTGDGSYQDHANDRVVEPGDVIGLAERIGEPNAELVRISDDSDEESGSSETEAEAEAESETFDSEAWLDENYQTRAQRVGDGDIDEHLDTIAEVETSETVQDAVEDRRDELEE
jgi:hypothetical protein